MRPVPVSPRRFDFNRRAIAMIRIQPFTVFVRTCAPAACPHERRVVWVGDSEPTDDPRRAALENAGYRVQSAGDPNKAIDLIVAEDVIVDVVVVDFSSSASAGLLFVNDLCRKGYQGKLVVITFDSNPLVIFAYQRLYADRIVYHPVLPSTLREAVDELFLPEWVTW